MLSDNHFHNMITEESAPDQEVYLVDVDGVAIVIVSAHASSEAYLLPDLPDTQTKLSVCSVSSSVHAETGARDIRHLTTLSTADDDERCISLDSLVSLTHEDRCQKYFASPTKHDRSIRERMLKQQTKDDSGQYMTWREGDVSSSASLPVKEALPSDDGSISSAEMDVHIPIILRNLDFSQSFKPAVRVPAFDDQRRVLTPIAPRTSRHQRHVEWLIVSPKQNPPSPFNANVNTMERPRKSNQPFTTIVSHRYR